MFTGQLSMFGRKSATVAGQEVIKTYIRYHMRASEIFLGKHTSRYDRFHNKSLSLRARERERERERQRETERERDRDRHR